MKKLELPKVGLRNIKTALAVFICMTLFEILDRESGFFACIAAVVCMKDTIENSYSIGKDRIIGTLTGGVIGIILLLIISHSEVTYSFKSMITSIGIILSIYIFTVLKRPSAVTTSCIVILSIICNHSRNDSLSYAVIRIVDTFLGVMIAILINKYITPPKKEMET